MLDYGDWARSWSSGSGTAWPVFTQYAIEHGHVVPRSAELARLYPPWGHQELPHQLATLRTGNEAALLDFVHTYGLLGFDALAPGAADRPVGDPIPWMVAHARTVSHVMEVLHGLQERDERGLRRLFGAPTRSAPIPTMTVAMGARLERRWVALGQAATGPAPLALARTIVQRLITENLAGVRPILHETNGTLTLGFTFDALTQAIYWQLATAASGGQIQRCAAKGCEGLFVQRDPRQRYCPRPFGEKGESLCALSERQRRWRQPKQGGSRHGTHRR